LRLNVTKFESLSRRIEAGIREEAEDLCRFLRSEKVDIEFN
jgi:hypothetical protein